MYQWHDDNEDMEKCRILILVSTDSFSVILCRILLFLTGVAHYIALAVGAEHETRTHPIFGQGFIPHPSYAFFLDIIASLCWMAIGILYRRGKLFQITLYGMDYLGRRNLVIDDVKVLHKWNVLIQHKSKVVSPLDIKNHLCL